MKDSFFTAMPMDVFTHVTQYLEPMALRHLAMTEKSCYKIITDPEFQLDWLPFHTRDHTEFAGHVCRLQFSLVPKRQRKTLAKAIFTRIKSRRLQCLYRAVYLILINWLDDDADTITFLWDHFPDDRDRILNAFHSSLLECMRERVQDWALQETSGSFKLLPRLFESFLDVALERLAFYGFRLRLEYSLVRSGLFLDTTIRRTFGQVDVFNGHELYPGTDSVEWPDDYKQPRIDAFLRMLSSIDFDPLCLFIEFERVIDFTEQVGGPYGMTGEELESFKLHLHGLEDLVKRAFGKT